MESLHHDHVTASKAEVTLTDMVEDLDPSQPEVAAHPSVAEAIATHTETTLTRIGSAKYVLMVTKNKLSFRL